MLKYDFRKRQLNLRRHEPLTSSDLLQDDEPDAPDPVTDPVNTDGLILMVDHEEGEDALPIFVDLPE